MKPELQGNMTLEIKRKPRPPADQASRLDKHILSAAEDLRHLAV